ncbi:leucine-rich repeat-containing protein 15-like [Bradysia coprophila]|uniref:leucine-rich repeat-containing protein 15-like n=1 Tax=Bradysia coprophila TaxID=38358 RepID=UPI00187D79B1|nr:leucine-rich repeat-containing protein 15-like [Bradysia coprophila]XP_037031009.1 leucine-rich repeat-containing protein 15-like [Bradysia coprophila]
MDMKYSQLVVFLVICFTKVHGRTENGHCEPTELLPYTCEVHLVEDAQQPITIVIFDENASANGLQIKGHLKSIPDISDATKKLVKLNRLEIRGVGLKSVRAGQLAAFERISELDVSDNQISELDAESFKELRDLEFIKLHNNEIEILPLGIFDSNQKLYYIQLNDNKLKEIHVDTFHQHPDLNFLYLRNNQIEVLSATVFRNNNKMHLIHLDHNRLKALHNDTFKGLKDLRFLELNENQIEILPKGLFDDNTKLGYVSLQNNKLMKIETDLQKLRKLISLNLTGNVCISQECEFKGRDCLSALIEDVQQKCSN